MNEAIQRAHAEGAEAARKVRELMNKPGYSRDPVAQAVVRQVFLRAYGNHTVSAPTGPGQAAADPFSRYE